MAATARSMSPTLLGSSDQSSSLDTPSSLVGRIDARRNANLSVDDATPNGQSPRVLPRSLKAALDDAAQSRSQSGESTPDSASDEDYDKLQHDPLAVMVGGKGGGFDRDRLAGHSLRSGDGKKVASSPPQAAKRIRTSPPALKGIPITLQKADQNGKYFLIADDLELKEILKMGIERENTSVLPKRGKKFSDLVFTRQFTAFDRQNTASAESPFHGFFTLFWLGTAIFMMQTAAKNWQVHGNVLGTNEVLGIMLHRDLLVLGLSDGLLCASAGFGWILQRLILSGFLSWDKAGWIIQNVWQIFYIFAVLSWTLLREWPWTHTVFFVLHGLVMLMKQHSYAFYNGHLSEIYKTRKLLEKRLKQLQNIVPAQSPSATTPIASSLFTSYLDQPPAAELTRRRQSNHNNASDDRAHDLAQVAAAIESGGPLDVDQIHTFERIIKWEIDALMEDLKGKSSDSSRNYPHSLTVRNHYEFILLPTLVYELEYPRSDKINWYYVAEKAVATFGILFIMMLVSQTFIYPVVVKTVAMKEAGMPLQQRLEEFPWVLSDLVFPFMMEYMMTWYVLFESILNLLAELTYFADRGFYGDWWNSVSWDQFARDWNRPVHNFLLRHVYHSSISFMRVNKYTATLITFFLSAVVHELIMWTLFKKLRGYLLFLQMTQIPLVQLSRSRWLKGKATLGNLIFWIGIFTGPSLLCSLYLIL